MDVLGDVHEVPSDHRGEVWVARIRDCGQLFSNPE